MKELLKYTIIVACIFPLFTGACENEEADCGSITSWHKGNNIELNMNDEKSENQSSWRMKIYSGNDIIIETDEKYLSRSTHGVLGIISGNTMITKGLALKSGYEIDAADGPVLMIQLLLRLLSEIAPEGPVGITESLSVDHKESKKSIKVATAAASAVFGAPWSVTGTLSPIQKMVVAYNLRFMTMVGDRPYKILLSGTWAKDNTLGELSGDKTISDWQIYKIGPYTRKQEGGTIVDYGAQPLSRKFDTLTDLRRFISQQ